MKEKRTLCFVTAHLPNPKSNQAGQRIVYDHLLWLSRDYRIILISCANSDELRIYNGKILEFCAQIHIFKVSNYERVKACLQKINNPWFVSFRYNVEIERLLFILYQSKEEIIFWFEYEQMCQYIPNCGYEKKATILVCHDVLHQMFERKVKSSNLLCLLYFIEKKRIEKWENECLKKCKQIVTLSEKDCELIRNRFGINNLKVIYPRSGIGGNASNYFLEGKKRSLIFFGAMNRSENENAVLWFLRNIWSELLRRHPDLKFYIVGTSPTPKICKNACENIIVTGFVDDPTYFFKKAWFAIAPIQIGAGVKIKVLECLSYGLPVVATSVGAEGIEATPEDGLFIKNEKPKFIDQCLSLLENEKECLNLGKKSRKWYTDIYKLKEENYEKIKEIVDSCR